MNRVILLLSLVAACVAFTSAASFNAELQRLVEKLDKRAGGEGAGGEGTGGDTGDQGKTVEQMIEKIKEKLHELEDKVEEAQAGPFLGRVLETLQGLDHVCRPLVNWLKNHEADKEKAEGEGGEGDEEAKRTLKALRALLKRGTVDADTTGGADVTGDTDDDSESELDTKEEYEEEIKPFGWHRIFVLCHVDEHMKKERKDNEAAGEAP